MFSSPSAATELEKKSQKAATPGGFILKQQRNNHYMARETLKRISNPALQAGTAEGKDKVSVRKRCS